MCTSKENAFDEMYQLIRPFHKLHGILVPEFMTADHFDSLATVQLDASDVWISTFPKAGTTWTQQIVKLIRNQGEEDDVQISKSVPWVENSNYADIDIPSLPKPRTFKSHMPYELMPCGIPNTTPCKYIYVTRNPKDVAVSLYFHYQRSHALPDKKIDWNLFYCNFLNGNVEFGNFLDHVLSWWPHRNDANVLFLKFEDMKRDLRAVVARIAHFIGADISDEIVAKVADKSTFKAMKANAAANYSWSKTDNPGTTDFMRKGEVGDWENYFTAEQSEEMDKVCREKLQGTGLDYTFKI
ncbi:sulfotransferase 1C4-like [Halichondria panicea]|uniref:sulfotransferase 1C4-like n=1 Tax=Halichondria panicea TaxID=6063 RepID=UPI00312B3152